MVERDGQFQDMAERCWISFLMFMLHPDDYLAIREFSHVSHQRCSHTFLSVVGHYISVQNLDFLFISILNQQVLTLTWEENWLGRGWGRHLIPASSVREINWALWWMSAACRCFWEASSVKETASHRFAFNGVATSSPVTPHRLCPLQNYCDGVTHNYQKQRPIITFPSDCANTNFKTREVLSLLPNYIL